MATKKKEQPDEPIDILDNDEDDLMPLAGSVRVPESKASSKPPRKKSRASTRRPPPDGGDEDGENGEGLVNGEGGIGGEFEQRNRKVRELEAQMQARLTGQPIFPYPPELPEHHKLYWTQLVNSYPKDTFSLADLPLLKMYVRAAYEQDRIDRLLEEEGEVVMGPRGPIANPRVKIRNDAANLLLSIATKIRAQPASRVNSDNSKKRQARADEAARGAASVVGDDDGLLAGRQKRVLQ